MGVSLRIAVLLAASPLGFLLLISGIFDVELGARDRNGISIYIQTPTTRELCILSVGTSLFLVFIATLICFWLHAHAQKAPAARYYCGILVLVIFALFIFGHAVQPSLNRTPDNSALLTPFGKLYTYLSEGVKRPTNTVPSKRLREHFDRCPWMNEPPAVRYPRTLHSLSDKNKWQGCEKMYTCVQHLFDLQEAGTIMFMLTQGTGLGAMTVGGFHGSGQDCDFDILLASELSISRQDAERDTCKEGSSSGLSSAYTYLFTNGTMANFHSKVLPFLTRDPRYLVDPYLPLPAAAGPENTPCICEWERFEFLCHPNSSAYADLYGASWWVPLLSGGKNVGYHLKNFMNPGNSLFPYFDSWLVPTYEGLRDVDTNSNSMIEMDEFMHYVTVSDKVNQGWLHAKLKADPCVVLNAQIHLNHTLWYTTRAVQLDKICPSRDTKLPAVLECHQRNWARYSEQWDVIESSYIYETSRCWKAIPQSSQALPMVTHVVYSRGLDAMPSDTGINVVAGVTYSIVMEVLLNDLGDAGEKVSGVTFNGHSIGGCNPDGGQYNCTFYNCARELTSRNYTATSDTINVDATYLGYSHGCDCDVNDWSCSKEGTVAGRTAITAVARFILTPIKDEVCEKNFLPLERGKLRTLIMLTLAVYAQLRDNGVEFVPNGGSFIGAVRHKGVIPWDDDADIWFLKNEKNLKMLRPNGTIHKAFSARGFEILEARETDEFWIQSDYTYGKHMSVAFIPYCIQGDTVVIRCTLEAPKKLLKATFYPLIWVPFHTGVVSIPEKREKFWNEAVGRDSRESTMKGASFSKMMNWVAPTDHSSKVLLPISRISYLRHYDPMDWDRTLPIT